MSTPDSAHPAARAWLRREQRLAKAAIRPVLLCGLAGTLLAIGQAWCASSLLSGALTARREGATALLVGFAALALLRAGLSYLTERSAFAAGAAARRRLRSDALSRLLQAGPAMLRTRHSADLTAIVVDRIEALDGFFARWMPAAVLAVAAPTLVLIGVVGADPWAALLLLVCGLLVPAAMAVAGLGAAAASRRQFVAMTRLQRRFLDRIRGIATIVLYLVPEILAPLRGFAAANQARLHAAGAADE
jgi:ATP-binding cassette subfamily C protein CydD